MSGAGGVGLGLVFGWLAVSAWPGRQPARVAGVLAGLAAVVAEVAVFADGAGAALCLAAMAVGGAVRVGVGTAVRRGVAA